MRWHQSRSELSAGGRVALEMVPGFTRAKKIKKKKKKKSDVKTEIFYLLRSNLLGGSGRGDLVRVRAAGLTLCGSRDARFVCVS